MPRKRKKMLSEKEITNVRDEYATKYDRESMWYRGQDKQWIYGLLIKLGEKAQEREILPRWASAELAAAKKEWEANQKKIGDGVVKAMTKGFKRAMKGKPPIVHPGLCPRKPGCYKIRNPLR
jgi:hypothetical protein